MKKATIVTILVSALLLSSLAGCGQGSEKETVGSETTPNATANTETESETALTRENTPDTLPADLDFGGEDIRILHRGGDHDVQVEIAAENTGDVVDSSIFNRNLAVEDRLNIKLAYEPTSDDIHNGPTTNDLVKAAVAAGDPVYDLFANHMSQTTPLVLTQHFYNLYAQPYLDFDMPWWNPSFREQVTLNGKNYMAAGDISQTMLRGTYVTIMNKAVLDEYYNGYDVYDTVRSGGWTFDEFLRLADMYHDVNGDGKADENDIYGVIRDRIGIVNDALIGSFDIPLVTNDGSGLKVVFNSEKTINFIERMQVLLYENNYAISQEFEELQNKLMDDTALMLVYLSSEHHGIFARYGIGLHDPALPEIRRGTAEILRLHAQRLLRVLHSGERRQSGHLRGDTGGTVRGIVPALHDGVLRNDGQGQAGARRGDRGDDRPHPRGHPLRLRLRIFRKPGEHHPDPAQPHQQQSDLQGRVHSGYEGRAVRGEAAGAARRL